MNPAPTKTPVTMVVPPDILVASHALPTPSAMMLDTTGKAELLAITAPLLKMRRPSCRIGVLKSAMLVLGRNGL